jgi:2-methylcitrate dehydratase PrpD
VAWAIGESLDLSGQEVVLAYTVGLEVICRLGSATPYGFHANGLHATQVCGAIAAAVVASKLMNLTVEQTVNAMGIAGSFSGGLLEFLHTGSSTKQIHPGIAAQGGYISALMAKNGATGPESVLEGEYGIFNSLSARAFDISVVEKDLGITWQAGEITIKPYPACQLSHVSLDAANLAFTSLQGAGYSVVDIESISADVHPDSAKIVCEPMVDKLHPRSAYDAKFSLPWSIAALLIDGGLTSRSFGEESISRPEVLELAKKFHYKDSPTSAVAAASHGEVEIKTFQGSTFKGSLPASFGSPSNRLSAASLRDKFVGQCPVGSKAEEFFENLITIESFAKIKELSTKMTALISE